MEDFEYLVGNTYYDDENGQLYAITKVFEGSFLMVRAFWGSAPLFFVSTKHCTVRVHVRDILLMTRLAKDSVSAAENVLKSDRVLNYLSSISELDSSTSPTDSPSDDVGQQKRLPASDNSRSRTRPKRFADVLNSLNVIDLGCQVDQTRQSLILRNGRRKFDPLDYVGGSRKHRFESNVAAVLTCVL